MTDNQHRPPPLFVTQTSSMLAKLHTFSLLGIDTLPVEVKVDVSPGALPKTVLVGLPEQAVKESTHRIDGAVTGHKLLEPAPTRLAQVYGPAAPLPVLKSRQ